jgi:acetylornithine deacetylase/succinyl-diaminopimelate desuccinylase-like protein
MATQVHALAALKQAGIAHRADIYVVAVVFEERAGLGSRFLAKTLPCDYVVLGEATQNGLMRGHRGRIEIVVEFTGRSVHPSMSQLGINPHFSAARFLSSLRDLPMVQDSFLGSATVAPTLYNSDQVSANVVPGRIELHLDWRHVPSEDTDGILERLQPLLDDSLVDGCQGALRLPQVQGTTWTGQEHTWPLLTPGFILPADDPLLATARSTLEQLYGHSVPVGHWSFATDGGHLTQAGASCIGFAPGDASHVHTVREHIFIEDMVDGLAGNMALALALGDL